MAHSSLTLVLFVVVLSELFCSSNATLGFTANQPYQSFPFFVPPFSTGEVTFGIAEDDTGDQLSLIRELTYCVTKLIPSQNKDFGECVTVYPSSSFGNTTRTFTLQAKLGTSFLQVYIESNYTVEIPIFIDTNDCEFELVNESQITARGSGGLNCSSRVILADDSNQVTVSNSTENDPTIILFHRTPSQESPSNYYVKNMTFLIESEEKGSYIYTSSDYNGVLGMNRDSIVQRGFFPISLASAYPAPSFSSTENTGQYWVMLVWSETGLPFEINMDYGFCDKPEQMTQYCDRTSVELNYSSMKPNVPVTIDFGALYPYNRRFSQPFVSIKNASNLKLVVGSGSISKNPIFDYLCFDNTDGIPSQYYGFGSERDIILIDENNIMIPEFGGPNWDTIFLQVYSTCKIPADCVLSFWTYDDVENMCPQDCNGICEPGNTVCTCADGSFSLACPDDDDDETLPWWSWLLIFLGAFVMLALGVVLGVFIAKKHGQDKYLSVS